MASGTGRLDRQKMTRRAHVRKNSRWYRRGYKVLPHEVWGDTARPPKVSGTGNPTGAIAGTPGSFTPAGCIIPSTLAQLQGFGALGQTTAWAAGQYVNLSPSGSAYWNGTAWALGVGTGLTNDPHVLDPGSFTIGDIEAWVDAHAEMADEVLAAERSRPMPRVTLTDWLEGFIAHRDD